MSIKKLLIAGASAAVMGVSVSALAGGQDVVAPSQAGVYVEGNVGWAHRNWENMGYKPIFIDGVGGAADGKKLKNTWVAGAALGYQVNQYLGAELGGFWLGRASLNAVNADGDKTSQFRTTSRIAYVAAKGTLPLSSVGIDGASLFTKVGVSYVDHKFRTNIGGATIKDTNHYFKPIFAAGAQYDINENLYVTGQWTYVPQNFQLINDSENLKYGPSVNLFTLGLGYKFAM